jgi:hypothetical protein
MNSFKQRTENLPSWAKAGITAAGMINPLTAIPSLISKFGSGSGGGGSYGIAGLDDRQKAMYNNLAASGYLYDTPGGMKTFDGKNFSQFDDKSIDNYFDSKTDKFGSIEEYEDYLNKDPKTRKNLIKTLQFYKQAKKGDDTFTDFSNITDPNITSDMIDEFTTNNNDGGGGTPPGFGTTPQGNYTNQFDGGDPGQGQGSNDHDGGASADAQSDDAAGMGGYARGGRAGYFFGGRVNYKKGGRINFKGGGQDASSDDFGGGDAPGPGDTGGEGGNKPSDGSDTQFDGNNNNNNGGNNNPPTINKTSFIDKIRYNPIINNPLTRLVGRVGMYSVNPSLMGLDYRTASQLKGVYDKATDLDDEDVTLNKYKNGGRVSFKNGGLASIL